MLVILLVIIAIVIAIKHIDKTNTTTTTTNNNNKYIRGISPQDLAEGRPQLEEVAELHPVRDEQHGEHVADEPWVALLV